MLTDPTTKGAELTKALDTIDGFLNDIVSTRAELGAQTNRAEMVDSRLLQQKVIATQTVSNNEDIEFEEAIMNFTIQESLHRASLAVGARIIQPTLMDFLR
jgi:flagellar hook-associated protein 3 FlgL